MESRSRESAMSVYRVTEIIGTSKTSWEDAAREALAAAAGSLRELRVAEVVELDITMTRTDRFKAARGLHRR